MSKSDFVITIVAVNVWPTTKSSNLMQPLQTGSLLYLHAQMNNVLHHSNLSRMNFDISSMQDRFLQKVDAACRSIRSYEEQCYLDEKLNDKVIPIFAKIGMLGCPVSKKY